MPKARRPKAASRTGTPASGQASLLSSRPFRQLIDTAPDAMVIVDGSGTIVVVNSQTVKLFGYEPEELIGRPVEVLVPERFQKIHATRHVAGYVAKKSPHARAIGDGQGLFGRRRDGSEFPAQISLTPLHTDEGVLISSFIRDLTPLTESESRYRTLFDDVPLGLFRSTPEGGLLEANPECLKILGFSSLQEFHATRAHDLYVDPQDRERYLEVALRHGAVRGFATMLKRRDGSALPAELSARAITDSQGRLIRIDGSVADVTERRSLQAQLIQAQKMEAVGHLAGGIAHDFNNLLSAITVFGELAAAEFPAGDKRREDLDNIQDAVQHATTLTRQLLAFSRQQTLKPVVLSPNAVVTDLLKILHRLIGEDVEMVTELDPAARLVRADASQLEQVLMNLVVNARDAMPRGGRLHIATAPARIARDHAAGDVPPGDYVAITVADTGTGMNPEVRARVFEPFFTTKGDKGTGLGLATVYGVVKQSGGHVTVASEPGRGATFTIYLPEVSGMTGEHAVGSATEALGGTETVLLAEDDAAVRLAVSSVLSRLGYTVLTERSAEDAVARAAAHEGPIHLVISDVVMPGMDGPGLIAELKRVRPDVRALLTSGYAGDAISLHRVMESGIPFLEKPFTAVRLSQRVREVLDAVSDGDAT